MSNANADKALRAVLTQVENHRDAAKVAMLKAVAKKQFGEAREQQIRQQTYDCLIPEIEMAIAASDVREDKQ